APEPCRIAPIRCQPGPGPGRAWSAPGLVRAGPAPRRAWSAGPVRAWSAGRDAPAPGVLRGAAEQVPESLEQVSRALLPASLPEHRP
ncbi:hypothetical protein, partial [Streptomyces sp. NPDC056387]|uniref:hypothetical protein n=1 Tax=Streptomyces sp. NPDC056387 TaxID=3345803 RepID=UPI0035DB13D5